MNCLRFIDRPIKFTVLFMKPRVLKKIKVSVKMPKIWTGKEEEILQRELKKKTPLSEISPMVNKTVSQLKQKIKKENLGEPRDCLFFFCFFFIIQNKKLIIIQIFLFISFY